MGEVGLSLLLATVGLSRAQWDLSLAWIMSNTKPYGRDQAGMKVGGGRLG